MNVSHNFGLFATDELYRLVIPEALAPGLFKANDLGAMALRHLRDAVGKITIGEHRKLRSGFYEVSNGSFHARAARTRNHQGGTVARAESHSQQLLVVSHHLDEIRIQVPDDGFCQRLINPRMNHAGSRSEQVTARRLQGRKNVHCGNVRFDGAHSPHFPAKETARYYGRDRIISRVHETLLHKRSAREFVIPLPRFTSK